MQREKRDPDQIRAEAPKPRKDFTGWIGWTQPEGRLTIETIAGYSPARRRLARCRCSCGNVVELSADVVIRQKVRSCGCLKREKLVERNTTHGGTGSRLFRIWEHALRNCDGENDRGILPAWRDFAAFRDWALDRGYRDDLTLGRIDPAGDYTPENCEWIPMKAQQSKRRNNVRIELEGELVTLAEASRRTGINRQTLADRLRAGKAGADLLRPAKLARVRAEEAGRGIPLLPQESGPPDRPDQE